MSAEHEYKSRLVWEGNLGDGTSSYQGYSRQWRVRMLTYLALCARNKISVLGYSDEASGVMKTTPEGGGRFESVTLRPRVEIADKSKQALATELHEKAHSFCFITGSVNFPVHHAAVVTAGG
jgi:hypothetical protein